MSSSNLPPPQAASDPPRDTHPVAWGFSGPGRLIVGRGSLSRLGALLTSAGWSRPLLVTDAGIRRAGHVERLESDLQAAGHALRVFDKVEPEPATGTPLAAVEVCRSAAFQPDVVIGLGGGSCIDVAKMTATLLRHGGRPADYFGFDRIPGPITPLVAIPTTAGTGSEASHSSVLTDHTAGVKVSTLSPRLRPTLALVDPQLTDSCPPKVTADSGIDALVHAIEAYTARDWTEMGGVGHEARAYEGAHPLGRLLASEAIELIDRHLAAAVEDGSRHTARDALALAALYAGMAFSNCGVAVVHALEYPLGALVHCSHGAGNGLLLPYVMQFNLPASRVHFAELAIRLGQSPHVSRNTPIADALSNQEVDHLAQWLIDRVIHLRRRIGIPDRLRDLGLAREAIPSLADKAIQIERLMTLNPRRPSRDDLIQILQSAY